MVSIGYILLPNKRNYVYHRTSACCVQTTNINAGAHHEHTVWTVLQKNALNNKLTQIFDEQLDENRDLNKLETLKNIRTKAKMKIS